MRPNLEMNRKRWGRGSRGAGARTGVEATDSGGNRDGWEEGGAAGVDGGAGSGGGAPGSVELGTAPGEELEGGEPLPLAPFFLPFPRSSLDIVRGT